MVQWKLSYLDLMVFGILLIAGCEIKNPIDIDQSIVTVRGSSMSPIYKNGDDLKVTYNIEEIQRDDIVIYNHTTTKLLKIAKVLPGDSFHVQGDKLIVNGEVMKNIEGKIYRFSNTKMLSLYEESWEGVMPEGVYFIFGNIPGLDSSKFGPALEQNIIGKELT
jgi:signal peptidase I